MVRIRLVVRRNWQHYAAPAAFLVAATVLVLLVRAGFESGGAPQSPTTGRTATVAKSTQRYWSVRAGDTFATIASSTGVSVARIRKLNPGVVSTALFIGQRIRIR